MKIIVSLACSVSMFTCMHTSFVLGVILPFNFSTFQQMANTLVEFPPCDDQNWVDPDYTTFLKNLQMSCMEAFLYQIGIKSKAHSLVYLFENILQETLESKRFLSKDKNSIIIAANPNTKLYVWGDVHASFHSVVRGIEWCLKSGIIDKDLMITKSDNYFVFFGDLINRGPYSMATLCFVLALMHKNPEQVIYVKGRHEQARYWENFGLKRELKLLTAYTSFTYASFTEKINELFAHLPSYLLVHTPTDPKSTLFFSFDGMKTPYIKNSFPFSTEPSLMQANISFKERYKQGAYIAPEAGMKTEDWRQEHRTHTGLGLLDPEFGTTFWAVLSSPIEVHDKFYGFRHDAFVCITMGDSVRTSTIQVINRERDEASFSQKEAYNIVTGRPLSHAQPHPVGADILLGATMPSKRGLPVLSKKAYKGACAAIIKCNREGGIGGRHVKYIVYDDSYVPSKARNNIKDLLERGIDLIVMPVGSSTLKAYKDFIKEGTLSVIFPITGNQEFGDSSLTNLVNLTTMNVDEITVQLKYCIRDQAVRHFAFVYQEDEYGKATLEAAYAVLREHGITKWLDLPYAQGTVDFTIPIEKIRKASVDAIVLLCTPEAAQTFIRKIDLEILSNKTLIGLSTLTTPFFKNFVQNKGLKFYFSSRVPNPFKSELPIVKEYRALMERDSYSCDNISLETYIGADLLMDVLKGLKDSISKDSIIKAIEAINNKSFKGFTLSFKPTDRSLDMSVWLEKEDEWIEITDSSRSSNPS